MSELNTFVIIVLTKYLHFLASEVWNNTIQNLTHNEEFIQKSKQWCGLKIYTIEINYEAQLKKSAFEKNKKIINSQDF